MKHFRTALWTERRKFFKSKVALFSAMGLSIAPLVGGLFMVILKDPEAARSMGLISVKAQVALGTADWMALFNMLAQAVAIGGGMVFAIVAIWVFGREFSDRTVKDLLALPTPREAIVAAKLVVIAIWCILLTLWVFALGLAVGALVDIPGWSAGLMWISFVDTAGASLLTIILLPFVALVASLGRGYLLPFGWTVLTIVLAQIAAFTGWGEYFPWAIPALFSGAAGPRAGWLGPHSYLIMAAACLAGLGLTFWWWRSADQAG